MRGDKDAFSELMDATAPDAYSIAYAILRNRADAEDVVQEAVISAMNGLAGLRKTEAFKGWFRIIVANRARDVRRRQQGDAPLDSNHHALPGVFHESDLSIDIRDAIGSLPDFHQQVILMYYSGLSTREVASALERPIGTVKRVLSEAYRILRKSLGPDYDYRDRRDGP